MPVALKFRLGRGFPFQTGHRLVVRILPPDISLIVWGVAMPYLEVLIAGYRSGLAESDCIALDEAQARLANASSAAARGRCLSAVACALARQTVAIADAVGPPRDTAASAHFAAELV
jgi:hypothetical protein